MNIRIDPRILQKYPNLIIGMIICKGIRNDKSPPDLEEKLKEAEAAVRTRFPDPEMIKSHPTIEAWQEIHRSFGSNPNKFPSSIHALCKRVAKGSSLPSINTLVDLYNIISLKYMVPVGGEDLDTCTGDIRLTFAEGNESFTPLGGSSNEPPEPGEVIYRDDMGVLCRKCNWREAARTCLTENTTNAVLVIEATPPTSRLALETALQELQSLVLHYCGGTAKNAILSDQCRSVTL